LNDNLKFIIPGEPCAQGRPRFTNQGGFVKAYDPEKSRNYKSFVKYVATHEAQKQGWLYTELPLRVSVTACLEVPASKSKKFREAAYLGKEYPTKKPDVDNLFKTVTDAMSGILYKDDKQIVQANIEKTYSAPTRLIVEIEVITE